MLRVDYDQASVQRTAHGVAVTFPHALLVASKEDPEQFRRRVLLSTLGSLYQQGKISSGLGAQVLGCDRWEFYFLLRQHGFSVIDYAEDEMVYEAETSRTLASQRAQP
jgi:predicted HTH domain antitoxin